MSKAREIILHILIGVIVLLLQIYLFKNIIIFGTKANLVLVYVVTVAILKNYIWKIPTSIVMGMIMDVIFKAPLLKYVLIYLFISIVIGLVMSRYRKESKLAIIYIASLSTVIFDVIEYILYGISTGLPVNIFSFLTLLLIDIVINVISFVILNKIYIVIERV